MYEGGTWRYGLDCVSSYSVFRIKGERRHYCLLLVCSEAWPKTACTIGQGLSSQVTFIYIALLTIQIVTKQLHNIKMGK